MPPILPPGPDAGPFGGARAGAVPADVAGLIGEIRAWAQFLNIDIEPTVVKFTQLLQTKPAAIWGGSDQLGVVAGGLDTEQGGLNQVRTDVGAAEMIGRTADAIGQAGADLVGQVAGTAEAARQLAGKLGQMATSMAENQSAAIDLTTATVTALGMLRT